jgi:hypothetical protein
MSPILLASALIVTHAGDKELITLIRESNQNSRAAIRTIHARLERVQTTVMKDPSIPPGEPMITKIEWSQDGDEVRCTEEETRTLRAEDMGPEMLKRAKGQRTLYSRIDCAMHAGELTMIALQRNPDGTGVKNSKITQAKDALLPGDIWFDALFLVVAKPRRTLAELLMEPSQVMGVERRGKEFELRVKVPPPVEDYELHIIVDPSRNFLVRYYTGRTNSTKATLRFEDEVLAFKEYAPGIYFPQATEGRSYLIAPDRSERLYQVVKTTYQSVSINQPIEPSVFRLTIPPKVAVLDDRSGTTYSLGKDGQREGEATAPRRESQPLRFQTEEQKSGSVARPIIVAGLAVGFGLLAALTFYSRKRLRRQQEQQTL